MSEEDTRPEVTFSVASDSDATRIVAVLGALGYSDIKREGVLRTQAEHLADTAKHAARRHKLTDREREILELVLTGHSKEEIGTVLEISEATVKWHTHNIFCKTHTNSREHLLRQLLLSAPVSLSTLQEST